MSFVVHYNPPELQLIQKLCGDRLPNEAIAHQCNTTFHANRPVRTAGSVQFATQCKLKISKRKFSRTCEVCKNPFLTSWPQARYCGEECKKVVEREYAQNAYRLNPAANVQAQTIRVRIRMEERWEIILQYFGDKCKKCQHTFPRIVYDLHHPDGKDSRKDTPSRIIRFGTDEVFRKMLAETTLLCANCHRLTHHESGNWAPKRKDT
jgi:hypothetical protein